MIIGLLASQTMRQNNSASVIPRTISQNMKKNKDALNKKNIMKMKKNMTTHQIFIMNQSMIKQPIKNLINRKASLT